MSFSDHCITGSSNARALSVQWVIIVHWKCLSFALSHFMPTFLVNPSQETNSHLLYKFEAPMMILVCSFLLNIRQYLAMWSAVGVLRKTLLNGWPSGCTKDVLEKLVPHTNLNKLQIHNYGGKRFRGWLGDYSFCNIVSLSFQNCEIFCILLPLRKLPSLKHFSIEGFDELVAVGPEFYGNYSLVAQRFYLLKY